MSSLDDSKPRISKKLVLLITAVVLVLLGAGTFALLYKGPGQDVPDSQEPMMDFAGSGSKLAEIQILVTQGGLTWQQYEKVYAALNQRLPELEPASRYFVYVEGSLTATNSGRSETSYDNLPAINVPDGDSDTVIEDEQEPSERVEMELEDTVVFTMRSESGAEYKVSVYIGSSVTTADVTIEKM